MPKLVSSKKRMRQEKVRRQRNSSIKSGMRTAIKKLQQETHEDARPAALRAACSALDKAAKRGAIHPRNAARRKARLMKLVYPKQA